MYLTKTFVESLGFQRIKTKQPGFHPPIILPIKEEFEGNEIHAGAFELKNNHKTIFLAVLKQGNVIVLQSEKKGTPINSLKIDGNSYRSKNLIEELITTYIKHYEQE